MRLRRKPCFRSKQLAGSVFISVLRSLPDPGAVSVLAAAFAKRQNYPPLGAALLFRLGDIDLRDRLLVHIAVFGVNYGKMIEGRFAALCWI